VHDTQTVKCAILGGGILKLIVSNRRTRGRQHHENVDKKSEQDDVMPFLLCSV
jgi:hypothetical protein